MWLRVSRYIKVSYPPYLFEVHLFAPVVEEQCSMRIGGGVASFRLLKRQPGRWLRLRSADSEDRNAMAEKRAEALEHAHKTAAAMAEERARKKRDEEQFAIRQQMRLEEEARERIEGEKRAEREKAEREMELWKKQKKEAVAAAVKAKEELRKRETPRETHKHGGPPHCKTGSIWDQEKAARKKLPPPRPAGSISVQFTPRIFPTAARESKEAEETEWLAKMAAARRIKLPDGDDSGESINERNPEFLKDRGAEFFKVGNYAAALNAFSEGIQLNPSHPQLFSNRAACYLAMGENERCINDCSRALELFYPVVPSNHASRTKALVRRGTAYANVGMLDLAAQDYAAALELAPHDAKLREDCARLHEAQMQMQMQEAI